MLPINIASHRCILAWSCMEAETGRLFLNFVGKTKQRRESASGADRRTAPRLPPNSFSAPISVSVNSFDDLSLVNISRGGALLQSRQVLRVNLKIALKVAVGGKIHKVMGRVLRSNIVGLQGGVQYHSAVIFEEEFSALEGLLGDPEPKVSTSALDAVSPLYKETPLQPDLFQAVPEDDLVFSPEQVLVAAAENRISDPALLQALELNHW
jgi:hypothetical protein